MCRDIGRVMIRDKLEQSISFKAISNSEKTVVRKLLTREWGSTRIVTRGKVHLADELPGYIAREGDNLVGLITYRFYDDQCEIISLNSSLENVGIGSRLLNMVNETASKKNCTRVWLITSNDNTHAIRFYQKRGYRLSALYRNAISESRKIKPEIPLIGIDDIPVRDEIELELKLIMDKNEVSEKTEDSMS